MKQTLLLTIAVVLTTAGVAIAGAPDDARDLRAEEAHRALQDAVELVEYTHSPDANVVIADGSVWFPDPHRARIGVVVGTSGFGDEPVGAVIIAVTPGGPADEAGLEAGDVITHVDGKALSGGKTGDAGKARAAGELTSWSRSLEDGQTVTIDYVRDGTPASVTFDAREIHVAPDVQFGYRPFAGAPRDVDFNRFVGDKVRWAFPSAWLDMELVALNPELGEYFASDRGVLVVRAPEDDSLGLASGDVILAIGGRDVRDPEHAMRILRSYDADEELSVDIVRHGRTQTLVGTVPEPNVELFSRIPRFSEDD